MARIQVADFFSGCGGTSAGLRQAGMQIVLGIDADPDAAATFQLNFPEAHFIQKDIRLVRTRDLKCYFDPACPVLFSACAPCQPFSKQNRAKRRADVRASLLDELHRFVRHLKPDYIFLENVPGIQRVRSRRGPLARFLRLLATLGYNVNCQVVDFLDYGVPQTRRRFVLSASRSGNVCLPRPTHGTRHGNTPRSTVWEWIGDLPAIPAGGKSENIPNHEAAALSPLNLRRIASTPEGGDRRDWPDALVLDCHQGHEGHTDVYGRLHKDRPASTLTTRCISYSNGRFGHPTQHRALSVREAASLQTFPRDFLFVGSLAAMAIQIGNAVPVLFARKFGESTLDHAESSRR